MAFSRKHIAAFGLIGLVGVLVGVWYLMHQPSFSRGDVRILAETMNAQLPSVIDDATTMTSVMFSTDGVWTYTYRLTLPAMDARELENARRRNKFERTFETGEGSPVS